MQKQPIESRVHTFKPLALFKLIVGFSILYLGAILLFAKCLHTLLLP